MRRQDHVSLVVLVSNKDPLPTVSQEEPPVPIQAKLSELPQEVVELEAKSEDDVTLIEVYRAVLALANALTEP